MPALGEVVDRVAREHDFSGAVRVDRAGRTELAVAYGLANRAAGVPNTVDTMFGTASGVKGLTALVVVSLIAQDVLSLSTTARSVLGDDLPLIGDGVTVEHLLSHRSGIGDYVDEDEDIAITDYVLPVGVEKLDTTEHYLLALGDRPAKFEPEERFSYCNGGYVVLALIAERASGVPFADLVRHRVCKPAGMEHTEFLRSDELPSGVALGYLPIEGVSRTNVFHLPVVGTGDGGIYSTIADFHAFWTALFAGRIVSPEWVAAMVAPRSDVPSEPGSTAASRRYGMGFWLAGTGPGVMLDGYDAGVSFRTYHEPVAGLTYTVVSNSSDGAWPVASAIAAATE
jgi:CubicO group peptidase (beta-lactamase class C family)